MLPTEKEKLKNIRKDMVSLGQSALKLNEEILEGLEQGNLDKLKNIKLVSKQEWFARIAEIDSQIINVFALYTPEAKDLRQLVAFLKITNEFDRITNSCQSFMRDFPNVLRKNVDKDFILEFAIPLQKTCVVSVKNAVALLETDDKTVAAELYKAVAIEEDENDDLYKIIERNLLKKMNKNIQLSREYQGAMVALRRLEKIADRALSIAFLMQYAVIGGEINNVKLQS